MHSSSGCLLSPPPHAAAFFSAILLPPRYFAGAGGNGLHWCHRGSSPRALAWQLSAVLGLKSLNRFKRCNQKAASNDTGSGPWQADGDGRAEDPNKRQVNREWSAKCHRIFILIRCMLHAADWWESSLRCLFILFIFRSVSEDKLRRISYKARRRYSITVARQLKRTSCPQSKLRSPSSTSGARHDTRRQAHGSEGTAPNNDAFVGVTLLPAANLTDHTTDVGDPTDFGGYASRVDRV